MVVVAAPVQPLSVIASGSAAANHPSIPFEHWTGLAWWWWWTGVLQCPLRVGKRKREEVRSARRSQRRVTGREVVGGVEEENGTEWEVSKTAAAARGQEDARPCSVVGVSRFQTWCQEVPKDAGATPFLLGTQ